MRIILVIGTPGTGKSLVGAKLAKADKSGGTQFFSVGDRMRELGSLVATPDHSTGAKKTEEARALIESELEYHLAEPKSVSTLVLECVKKIDDAFTLMDILKRYDAVRLEHVLFVSEPSVGRTLRKDAGFTHAAAYTRDAERLVLERQDKWMQNARGLIEFFSSMQIMLEVSTAQTEPLLARLGYGEDAEQNQPARVLLSVEKLRLTPIQPVISKRLITDRSRADAILRRAEEETGLRMFSPAAKLPVPSTPIMTERDAQWVGWPDRYCVSRKCDGTRHLLIADGDGLAWLRTRAGSLYAYPIETRLAQGTVLDGELVWIGGEGFFLAFDVISTGGPTPTRRRAWQLSLPERTSLLKESHPWIEEADANAKMQSAAARERRSNGRVVATATQAWAEAQAAWEKHIAEATATEFSRRKTQKPKWNVLKGKRAQNQFKFASVEEWTSTLNHSSWRRAALEQYVEKKLHQLPEMCRLHTKQQAPISDKITVVWKQHLETTEQALRSLDSTQDRCPYPTDGLVFTPKEPSYALGMTELLRKWQPESMIAADIVEQGPQDHRLRPSPPMELLPGLVYECRLSSHVYGQAELYHAATMLRSRSGARASWTPLSIRWDKTTGNNEEALDRMERKMPLTFDKLVETIRRSQATHGAAMANAPPTARTAVIHPARAMAASGDMQHMITEAVANGIERTVDKETGLEIFNRLPHGPSRHMDVLDICRGLVCHGPTIVATPFPRFRDQLLAANKAAWEECATATLKVDGALAIAFLWNGELQVSTRRRMDSQQALWAKEWLRAHTQLGAFEAGWTYLFEAVFTESRVVVPYPFEAAILLAAYSPEGACASREDCASIAARMGVMLVPSVTGPLEELHEHLAAPASLQQDRRRDDDCKPLPPTHEGWVVTTADRTNTKLVSYAYMRASMEAGRLHPLDVWDRVRTGGESKQGMLYGTGLAVHHREELVRMLDVMQEAYTCARRGLFCIEDGVGYMKGDPGPESMHYMYGEEGHMRVRLLDQIRPSTDGMLGGYTPSVCMGNTFAKGWIKGPKGGRFNEPLIHAKLHDPLILGLILESLEDDALINAMLVDRRWSSIVCTAPGIQDRLDRLKCSRLEEATDRHRHTGYGSDWTRHSYTGYGSD